MNMKPPKSQQVGESGWGWKGRWEKGSTQITLEENETREGCVKANKVTVGGDMVSNPLKEKIFFIFYFLQE